MALITANCPSCGAEIQIPDDRDTIHCVYCGQQILVEREDQPAEVSRSVSPDVANYMSLAETASESENHAEAEKYFSLVLERDPRNVKAWIGKAMAAGWQSTIRNTRLNETTNYIKQVVKSGTNDPEQTDEIISGILSLTNAIVMLNFNHVTEFGQVSGTVRECIPNLRQAVELLALAWSIKKDRVVAKNIAHILGEQTGAPAICSKFLLEQHPPILELYNECVTWLQANDAEWVEEKKKAQQAAAGCRGMVAIIIGFVCVIILYLTSC